jgi:hypothetical protein
VTAAQTIRPAGRGDVVVVEFERASYTLTGRGTHLEWEIHVVTGVTRSGEVKATRDAWGHDRRLNHRGGLVRMLLPRKEYDLAALTTFAAEHTYPWSGGRPMSFQALEEIERFAATVRRSG